MNQQLENPKQVSLFRFCLGYFILFAILVAMCWLFYVTLQETIAADWAYIRYGRKSSNYLGLLFCVIYIPLWIGLMIEIFKMRFSKPKIKDSDEHGAR